MPHEPTSSSIDAPIGHDAGSILMTDDTDANADAETADLEAAVERFLRDARTVYEEYDEGYLDPDAALWTLDGHINTLEDTLDDRLD